MLILGIDPGINNTGWGIIKKGTKLQYVASGVIKTSPEQVLPQRIAHICREINKVLEIHKPDITGLEEIFMNKNAESSLKLGHARGAIMSMVAMANIPIHEYAARKVKKSLVGTGSAEKQQIIHMINLILPDAKVSQSDEADSLAVAYCCSVHN